MTFLPRFEHRAVPIVLAAAAIDVIGFGIIMPVLPALITQIAHVDLAQPHSTHSQSDLSVRTKPLRSTTKFKEK